MTEEQVKQIRKGDWVCLSERVRGNPQVLPWKWMVASPLSNRSGASLKLYLPRNFARGDLRLEMEPAHWDELELATGMVTLQMLQERFGANGKEYER